MKFLISDSDVNQYKKDSIKTDFHSKNTVYVFVFKMLT